MGYDIILKNIVTGTARGCADTHGRVTDRLIPIVLFNNFKLIFVHFIGVMVQDGAV